ncbi:MAG: hypothetical protein Q8R35_01260 [bacterium]|nr:hypothetical protein [bacterium]
MPSQTGPIAGLGKVRLVLELTPQPTPTGGDILAVVLLTTDPDQRPIEGQAVIFWRGADEESTEPTVEHGRASHVFTGFEFGTHASISAQVAGVSVSARHTFNPPVVKSRVPTSWKVHAHPQGPAEKCYVSVEVFGDDQLPVKSWPIEIKDVGHLTEGQRQRVEKSGDDGAYRFTVDVASGKPREIFISIVGTSLDSTLRLPGPPPASLRKPPDVPELGDTDLAGSFLDITRRAVQQGREALRRERGEHHA